VQECARLSSLIEEALAGRPQRISRRGTEVAVLVSATEYDRLITPAESLVEFFRRSALAETEAALDLERDQDAIRDITWRAGYSIPT
jgi:antitoxin Phd